MRTLGKMLGSTARTEILRVLACQPAPIGLRPAARIAGLHAHSTELALKSLCRDGVVTRLGKYRLPLYELNRSHPDIAVMLDVFKAAATAQICLRRQSMAEKGLAALPFIKGASQTLKHARRSLYAS